MKTNRVRGNSNGERKRQRKVYDSAQLPGAWVPTDGLGALTVTERSWLSMSDEVECIRGATVNTIYNFRTQRSELTNSTDNTQCHQGDEVLTSGGVWKGVQHCMLCMDRRHVRPQDVPRVR